VGTGCYLVRFILVLGGQERREGKRPRLQALACIEAWREAASKYW